MPSRTEDLTVCESWKNKGRWKKAGALISRLKDDQSSWAFVADNELRRVADGIEAPWLALHAASFLLLASAGKERSQVGTVSFPRDNLPPELIAEDAGDHAVAALNHWHRTLDASQPSGRQDLAERIAESSVAKRFTRLQLAPLLRELLDAGLVRGDLRATAQRLVRLS